MWYYFNAYLFRQSILLLYVVCATYNNIKRVIFYDLNNESEKLCWLGTVHRVQFYFVEESRKLCHDLFVHTLHQNILNHPQVVPLYDDVKFESWSLVKKKYRTKRTWQKWKTLAIETFSGCRTQCDAKRIINILCCFDWKLNWNFWFNKNLVCALHSNNDMTRIYVGKIFFDFIFYPIDGRKQLGLRDSKVNWDLRFNITSTFLIRFV